jgi:hypothetical protein
MPNGKGTSSYVKPKQQVYREIDEMLDDTKPAPNQQAPTPAPVVAPAPTPGGGRSLWDWKK